MMDPRKKSVAGCSQFGESRFLSSFSQSKSSQSGEPTPKKPKLDILKNVKMPDCATQSVAHKKETMLLQEALWGDELNCDELAQIEFDENIALTQMSMLSQNNVRTAPQDNRTEVKHVKTNSSEIKNTRVPIRRFSSSQWPSSSFSQKENEKGPGNTAASVESELEKLRLENLKLKEEMNKKAGEAKLLRIKMKDAEKQYERTTQTYITKASEVKMEAEKRSSSLQKEIQSLKGQLDVKNMEIKTAERRAHMSSSVNRIQPESPNRLGALRPLGKEGLEYEWDWSHITRGMSLQFIRDCVMPELMKPSLPEVAGTESLRSSNTGLFSGGGSYQSGRCLGVRRELAVSHTCITPCAALLMSPSLVDITSDSGQQVIPQVMNICHKILTELLKQLESTMCSNNRFTERERELLLSGSQQLTLDKDYDLISHRELYSDERGVTAQRALWLLTLFVQASHFASQRILSSCPKEDADILETMRNIVRQIEKQRRTLKFQGVLAGSVTLIQSLVNSGTAISKETQTLLVDILRWVVFARPGSLVIRNILEAFLAAARYPHMMDSLCQNSDSCTLQVLCSLVKAVKTSKKHQLTDLFTRWVLSLFCSSHPRPQWLLVNPCDKTCQCHSLVCKLCFSLLSDTCFDYPSASGEDQCVMEKVLARGVLLVNTLMNENEHLVALTDPHSLGCYEHFLQFMSEAKTRLDNTTRDTLAFLCSQEEVLKQTGNCPNEEQNKNLTHLLHCFQIRENGKHNVNILDEIDDL